MPRRVGVPIKLWLDEDTLNLLRAECLRRGIDLLPDCAAEILREALSGGSSTGGPDISHLTKRLERTIVDILNPFTAKIDEINRKLADIIESLEEGEAREEAPSATSRGAPQWERGRRARRASSAIERLKADGVVFEEDVRWMNAPERFFLKLEREGAIVIDAHGEKIAVDPDFWREFLDAIETIQISDLAEAANALEEALGPRAARLFRRLARAGFIHFNEDRGTWEASESLKTL